MWMSGCRTRSVIVLEDEILTIFIPGLDLIPSGVHPEDACRVCRCVPSVAYTTIVAVHKQSPRNIPEGCVDGTRPCTEGKQSPIRQGGARHPPCSLPLRWNRSSLRGRVDTAGRMGASVHVLAFDHLARGRRRGSIRDCARPNRHCRPRKTGYAAPPDAHVISVSAVEPGCWLSPRR